jgi:hypothetical protein
MGGGGTSTKTDFPDYLKEIHEEWLGDGGSTYSITTLLNTLRGDNPYNQQLAYDPVTELTDAWTSVSVLRTVIDAQNYVNDYASAFAAAYDASSVQSIADDADAFSAYLHHELLTRTLPELRFRMHELNAVDTSAYPIAQSHAYAFKARKVGDFISQAHTADLADRINSTYVGTKQILNSLMLGNGLEYSLAYLSAEAKRIELIAQKESLYEEHSLRDDESKWAIETYAYGTQLIASIHGSSLYVVKRKEMSQAVKTTVNAASFAVSGAVIGSVFGPIGTIVGAVVGLLVGIGVSFL